MKPSNLIGPPLDWAVAHAKHGHKTYVPARDNYSTCWNKGGPVIETVEGYCMEDQGTEHPDPATRYYCSMSSVAESWHNHPVAEFGPTPLIAAMRCYVASKLGDNVDIPKEIK